MKLKNCKKKNDNQGITRSAMLLCLGLSACGGGGGDNDNGPPSSPNATATTGQTNNNTNSTVNASSTGNTASKLEGAWSHCNRFDATSSEFTFEFTGNQYTYTKSDYLNNDCSGTPPNGFDQLHSGTFTLNNDTTTSSGLSATEVNFHIENAFGAALGGASYFLYDLFAIQNGTLYFGDDSDPAHFGFEPSTRPIAIDFDDDFFPDTPADTSIGVDTVGSDTTGSDGSNNTDPATSATD